MGCPECGEEMHDVRTENGNERLWCPGCGYIIHEESLLTGWDMFWLAVFLAVFCLLVFYFSR